jgi:hypothetical protein
VRPRSDTISPGSSRTTPKSGKRISGLRAPPGSDDPEGSPPACAIDFTNDPYSDTALPENESPVIRSRLEQTTSGSCSYGTACALTRNRRATPAVNPVTKGTAHIASIARGLAVITEAGVMIGPLCPDRGVQCPNGCRVPDNRPGAAHRARSETRSTIRNTRTGPERDSASTSCGKNRPRRGMAVVALYASGRRGKRGAENPGSVIDGID